MQTLLLWNRAFVVSIWRTKCHWRQSQTFLDWLVNFASFTVTRFACSLQDAILSGARLVSKLESHSLKFRVLDSFVFVLSAMCIMSSPSSCPFPLFFLCSSICPVFCFVLFYFVLYTYLLSLHVKFGTRFPSESHAVPQFSSLLSYRVFFNDAPCLFFVMFVVVLSVSV